MKILKYCLIPINAAYTLMVIAFVVDLFGIIELKGDRLVSYIHFGSILLAPVMVLLNLLIFKIRKPTFLFCIPPFVVAGCLSFIVSQVEILDYLFSIGSYQTQTVLYENSHDSDKVIEFQMKDFGAFGYDKRYVEVSYFTPWFMITKEIDPEEDPGPGWIKVDKEVNELEIKY